MSIINSQPRIGAAGQSTGFKIERSLRFNSADSAYLSRTPASAGNRKTWTWSGWVKRSALGDKTFFSAYIGSGTVDNEYFAIEFRSNTLFCTGYTTTYLQTTPVYRDVSAWYMITVAVDTTSATANNRIRLYVNGVEITTFSTRNNPSQNADLGINQAANHTIGRQAGFSQYFDGYLTEVNFIDGQALTPSSFGETDTDTGVWKPKAYSGSYGTNGFYLKFADNSGTTSTTLGKDSSGNGNNWTPNNFSVTAGAGNDSLVDTPTPYGTDTGAGGEVRGNYCTLNPLTKGAYLTLSNGNLQTAGNSATDSTDARSTFAFSTGKWYWEFTPTTINSIYPFNGIILSKDATSPNTGTTNQVGVATDSCAYLASGSKRVSNSTTSYGNSYTANDVIGVAVDADNGAIYFSKNGTWQNSGSPTSGSSKTGAAFTWTGGASEYVAAVSEYNTSAANINFGQRPFAYTAPSGFKALCTQNLPTPTIGATATTRADDYFNTVLYTGDGNATAQAITGVGFQPDFVWLKARSQTYEHIWSDRVRGAGKILYSSLTNAEATVSNFVSFDSDGFTVNAAGGASSFNQNGTTYASWNWKANGAGSTNNAGSIQSTVSASTLSGFSIVTYTGTGVNATVGHGLGVAPQMVIVKNRTSIINWPVWHIGLTSGAYAILLDTQGAQYSQATVWNSTIPTSSVISVGTVTETNKSGDNYVAYCFAPVANYSSFGKYVGNGSSDGPFIYTGFRPACIIFRVYDGVANWLIHDNKRNTYNVVDKKLFPNLGDAEATADVADFLSNGFKLRGTNTQFNGNGYNYIYAAFAENPFKYSLAR